MGKEDILEPGAWVVAIRWESLGAAVRADRLAGCAAQPRWRSDPRRDGPTRE